jgi:hypothetical protein
MVPVPRLELQLAVAQRRGLQERCELIRQALAADPTAEVGGSRL